MAVEQGLSSIQTFQYAEGRVVRQMRKDRVHRRTEISFSGGLVVIARNEQIIAELTGNVGYMLVVGRNEFILSFVEIKRDSSRDGYFFEFDSAPIGYAFGENYDLALAGHLGLRDPNMSSQARGSTIQDSVVDHVFSSIKEQVKNR
ncbi:MAG: hypothetical protein HYW63_01110 [Candidatus Levybacteria bacterium]|nr:hypothetical protein [Candidatus Levybacteria bacterium]